MKTENKILMARARQALEGKWGLAVITFTVYIIIVLLVQVMLNLVARGAGSLAVLLIAGPLVLGLTKFSLSLVRKEEAKTEQLFSGFNQYVRALSAYLLVLVYVILWMLLLIIPGIIAAYGYSQTFFILAEDDTITPSEAMAKSKKMMDGYKLKLFYLHLRFLGWAILCLLTLGIGFLILAPYAYISYTEFYLDLKEQPVEAAGSAPV